jgi:hypothetical protein
MNTDDQNVSRPVSVFGMVIRGGIILALASGAYFFCRSTPNITAGNESGVIMNLPEIVDGFTGESQAVSESELHMLPKDTEFAKKVYKNFGGQQISSQIVLAGGEKRSIHRPEICLPAQGWNLKTGQAVPIKLDNGETLEVMKLLISRPIEVRPGVQKELTSIFLYWFVGKDMTTPYHWMRLAHANWDRVVHNINHRWAYVIVSAPVLEGFAPNGKSEEETMKMLESFVAELAPEITQPSVRLAGKK